MYQDIDNKQIHVEKIAFVDPLFPQPWHAIGFFFAVRMSWQRVCHSLPLGCCIFRDQGNHEIVEVLKRVLEVSISNAVTDHHRG